MKQVFKYTGYLLLLAFCGYLIWRFSYMIVWILVAAVLSFIGQPMVRVFDRLHFKRLRIPHTFSAFLALGIILVILSGIIAIFVPLIVRQAETISKIDVNRLAENLEGSFRWFDEQLHYLGAIPEGQTMQDFLVIKAKSVVNLGNVSALLNNFFSVAGNVFIGLFSVFFISFFFLKDENMFEESLLLFIPEKNHPGTRKVIAESKNLLMRYFIGILVEILCVMTIISFGLWLFGVPNALLIGFFCAIMNIIPYLGPVIGTGIAIMLGITTTLVSGSIDQLLPVLLKISGVCLTANFIDNNILIPLIYSKSVKSHPLEIYLVIIIGGSLAGLPGMVMAVPVYTILRVIGREFFQQFRIVKKLTATMKEEQDEIL